MNFPGPFSWLLKNRADSVIAFSDEELAKKVSANAWRIAKEDWVCCDNLRACDYEWDGFDGTHVEFDGYAIRVEKLFSSDYDPELDHINMNRGEDGYMIYADDTDDEGEEDDEDDGYPPTIFRNGMTMYHMGGGWYSDDDGDNWEPI